MKTTCLILAAALALAARATAAEIPLADGRVLHDATIRSQTPRTVIIKHEGGLSSVAKKLLPPELQAYYPVDEASALTADAREDQAAEATREMARDHEEQRVLKQAQLAEAAAIERTATQASAEKAEREKAQQVFLSHRRQAERLITHYFRERSDNGFNYSASIRSFTPVNGTAGPFLVTGTVTITSRSASHRHGYSRDFYQSEPGSPHYVQGDFDRVPPEPFTTETKDFESTYFGDAPEPTISAPVY